MQLSDRASVHLKEPVPRWLFVDHWTEPSSIKALTRAQREKMVCLTAASNHVPNLKLALAITSLYPSRDLIIAAACSGALDSCRFLAEPGRLPGPVDWVALLQAGAGGGHRHICEWVLNRSTQARKYLQGEGRYAAVAHGHRELAEWMMAQAGRRVVPNPGVLSLLALTGYDLPSYLQLGVPVGPNYFSAEAALCSKTHDWQAKVEYVLGKGAVLLSAAYGRVVDMVESAEAIVERFRWLEAKGCPLQPDGNRALRVALRKGHALALEWLLERREELPLDPRDLRRALRTALEKGHLAALQALDRGGFPFRQALSVKDMAVAGARSGSIDMIDWAWDKFQIQKKEGFTRLMFSSAAAAGSVEAMRCLAGRRVRATKAAWSQAVESGCEAAVELLAELRCPMPLDGCPYRAAASSREWRMLPLLWSLGVPSGRPDGRLFKQALRDGAPVATLRWLVEAQGLPLDWAEAEEVARKEYPGNTAQVLAWIVAEQTRHEERGKANYR